MGAILAKGAIILAAIGIIAFVILLLVRAHHRQEDKRAGRAVRGDMSRQQERALIAGLDEAANIMRRLLAPPSNVTDFTVLAGRDRADIERWLRKQNTWKGIRP